MCHNQLNHKMGGTSKFNKILYDSLNGAVRDVINRVLKITVVADKKELKNALKKLETEDSIADQVRQSINSPAQSLDKAVTNT